jgi:hypothetical protein
MSFDIRVSDLYICVFIEPITPLKQLIGKEIVVPPIASPLCLWTTLFLVIYIKDAFDISAPSIKNSHNFPAKVP